jgi:Mg-chelatase subunit ChlD
MRTPGQLVLRLTGAIVTAGGLLAAAGCTQDVKLPAEVTPPPPAAVEVDASPGTSAPMPDAGTRRDSAVTCDEVFDFRQESPQVVVALDRSASMWQKYGSAVTTRLEDAQQALRTLMATYHDAVHMGYVDFPAADCPAAATPGCCASQVISPGRDTGDAIQRRWSCGTQAACTETNGDAPMSAALRSARDRFADLDQPISSRHVFLLTDSEPTCGMRPGTECNQSITEAALLSGNENVETDVYVLAEELETSSCLQSIAGVRQDPNMPSPRYHVTPTPAALLEALDEKLATLSRKACTFRLSSPLRPPDFLVLYFGDGATNTVVPRDPLRSNGWEFEPDSVRRLTVYGPLCEALRTSQVADVDVEICTPNRGNSRRP